MAEEGVAWYQTTPPPLPGHSRGLRRRKCLFPGSALLWFASSSPTPPTPDLKGGFQQEGLPQDGGPRPPVGLSPGAGALGPRGPGRCGRT